MMLSELTQKGGLYKFATATVATPATSEEARAGTVAKVASVAVANATESKADIESANDPPLLVEAWTPSGIRMVLEANSPEHAEWIQRMNPWRPHYATPENTTEGEA